MVGHVSIWEDGTNDCQGLIKQIGYDWKAQYVVFIRTGFQSRSYSFPWIQILKSLIRDKNELQGLRRQRPQEAFCHSELTKWSTVLASRMNAIMDQSTKWQQHETIQRRSYSADSQKTPFSWWKVIHALNSSTGFFHNSSLNSPWRENTCYSRWVHLQYKKLFKLNSYSTFFRGLWSSKNKKHIRTQKSQYIPQIQTDYL